MQTDTTPARIGPVRLVGSAPAAVALGFFIGLSLLYSTQPPLENHSFRQTQTALTAWWFVREGFSLAYLTPVGGPPWSIPFEFPLYQALVALLADSTGLSVATAGRLTSCAFMVGCLPPVATIVRRLGLPELVFHSFVVIALSGPLYVFWGRSVLIETTALWLTLMTIRGWLLASEDGWTVGRTLAFVAFATLAMLQKTTTALPVLIVLAGVHGLRELGRLRSEDATAAAVARRLAHAATMFAFPVAIGAAWVAWTDSVKGASVLGRHLTSDRLTAWVWGTLEQRLSAPLWDGVVLSRLVEDNLGGLLGLALLIAPLLVHGAGPVRRVATVALAMGLLPLLMFPNLHIAHTYYQVANAAFLMFAVALGLGAIIAPRVGSLATGVLLFVMLSMNLYISWNGVVGVMQNDMFLYTQENMVAAVIRRETPPEARFVASGASWSPVIAYLSQRRGLMIEGGRDYEAAALEDPARFVEPGLLGAVVDCRPVSKKSAARLLDWAAAQSPRWKVGDVAECAVAVPARTPLPPRNEAPEHRCEHMPMATLLGSHGRPRLVRISGWAGPITSEGEPASAVFVELRNTDGSQVLVEAVLYRDVLTNESHGVAANTFGSYAALIDGTVLPPGEHDAVVVRVDGTGQQACAARLDVPERPDAKSFNSKRNAS